MRTRILRLVLFAILISGTGIPAGRAAQQDQSLRQLFERARLLEEKNQDLAQAIQLYEQVVSKAKEQRALAAKAQLQIGLIYERLGRKAEAQRAFRTVVNDFADQPDVARQAREKIPNGASGSPAMTARRVWDDAYIGTMGAVSRDGRFVSMVDWGTGDLAIREIATGAKRRLTSKGTWSNSSEYAEFSVPSPDGRQVAYAWLNKNWKYDLRVVSLDGASMRILVADQEYIQPGDWSPDGKWIPAYLTRKDGASQIVRIAPGGGSVQVLKDLGWRHPLKLGFSPDGRYIVYDFPPREDSSARNIYLLSADGSRDFPLVQHPANDFAPVWTPDGTSVLFLSDRTGAPGLWLLKLSDGKPEAAPQLVKADVGPMWPMGFGRNGCLYYGLHTATEDVYVASLDPDRRKLTQPTQVAHRFVGSNSSPDWSPDGHSLAYVSKLSPGPGGLTRTIIIRSLDTEQEYEVTARLLRLGKPLWSGDGRSFLVAGQDAKGVEGIFRVDAHSGEAALVVAKQPGEFLDLAARAADGKKVILVRTAGNVQRVSVRDLDTGLEKPIPAGVASSWAAVSPDSRWVVFRTWHGPSHSTRLTTLPMEGGEARQLVEVREPEFIPGFGGLAWSPDGKEIWFVKADPNSGDSFALWRVPFHEGNAEPAGLTMPRLRDLSFHPDGRRITFTAGQQKYEIWALENFLPALKASR